MKIATKVLVTKGNYPIFPAGGAVWNAPAGKKSPTLNVAAGQFVVYNPLTNLSLGVAATVETNPNVVLAVGVNRKGYGAADYLLTNAGKVLKGCAVEAITARGPSCGNPAVTDLLFSCVDANEPYTVKITAWDSAIRSQYDYNRPAEYVFTKEVVDGGCTDCSSADVSRQLACELVDAINGKQPAGWEVSRNGVFIERPELPFEAARLFNISTVWCLTAAEVTGCDNCTAVERVYGIRIGAGATTVFTNANTPGNVDQTLHEQLYGIVEQINTFLDGNGSATLVASGAPCCPYSIEINSCTEDVILVGWDAEDNLPANLTPCDTPTDPLTVDVSESTCKDCEEGEDGTLTYPAGIRIFGRPVDVKTGCYISQEGSTYLGREIEVYPYGGFKKGTTKVVQVQRSTNATNLGVQLIQQEYRSDLEGGAGRFGRPSNSRTGRYGLPYEGDRLTQLLTDQHTSYCVINLDHTIPQSSISYHGDRTHPKLRTRIWIPNTDTVTRTDVLAFLNAYLTTAPCGNVSVTCG